MIQSWIQIIGIVICIELILFNLAAFLALGFWMGRKTQGEKDIIIGPPDKTGGQPTFEEDPYADAMRYEKTEGSL